MINKCENSSFSVVKGKNVVKTLNTSARNFKYKYARLHTYILINQIHVFNVLTLTEFRNCITVIRDGKKLVLLKACVGTHYLHRFGRGAAASKRHEVQK